MSFAIFEETTYLKGNPDVTQAVRQGLIAGLQHFQQFGLAEGRVQVSLFFDERIYLASYPDVNQAEAFGIFASGLEHFIKFGESEGRTQVSGLYDESDYLSAYPDVARAVSQGQFSSGLQHFLSFGRFEGRLPKDRSKPPFTASSNAEASFNEELYLQSYYPDVKLAVEAGTLSSGLDHYLQFGQFEGRTAIFSGSAGSDMVSGFSLNANITGVQYAPSLLSSYFSKPPEPISLGVGEVDTLVGGAGRDTFWLGDAVIQYSRVYFPYPPYRFYVGGGDADYAVIENFTSGHDQIRIGGSIHDYRLESIGGDIRLSTLDGDLIAIVQQVNSLNVWYAATDYTVLV